jgi:drug/metabolite transporter (DMT)-like permease
MHIAVVLFGFTAILGDLITLNALNLVWWRMFFTTLSLLFLARWSRIKRTIDKKLLIRLVLNGAVIALHWLCFYASIKLANASVALVCLASGALFASIFEPLLSKSKINKLEIILGLFVIPGMVLVVSNLDISMINGVLAGIAAAMLAALFAAINKKFVNRAHSFDITLIELGGGWLFLSLVLPFVFFTQPAAQFMPSLSDLIYLIILALLCTTLAFILSLQSLTQLSAFNSTLIVNLEPIYGIILAAVILKENEQLNAGFYFGVLMIMATVFSYPILKRRFAKF